MNLFTKKNIQKIKNFQNHPLVHPLTCGNENCRSILDVDENGLFCPYCSYRQTYIPDYVLKWE